MGLTQSINIASQAMNAMQTALTVVSQNVANVSTEGYHKLRANFQEVLSYSPMTQNPIALAKSLAGVQVSEIVRYSDDYMQSYFWNENGKASYLEEYSKVASQIEDLMNELNETGLAKTLSDFYSAVDTLNDDPTDLTARQNYISAAVNLCDTFNNIADNIKTLQESTNGTLASVDPSYVSDDIHDINDLVNQIAGLNESIMKTNSGSISSASLINKRDELLNQLSSKMNIDVKKNTNNTVSIYLKGTPLLNGKDQVTQFVAKNSLVNGAVVTKVSLETMQGQTVIDNVNDALTSGSLKALLDLTGTQANSLNISNIDTFLNQLASEFAQTMNRLQTQDITTTTAAGTVTTQPLCIEINNGEKKLTVVDRNENIFVPKNGTQITAGNISVNDYFTNSTLSPYRIAAARLDITIPQADYEKAIGNNANATMIVETRSQKSPLLNATFEGFVANNVSTMGYQLRDLDDKLETQNAIVGGIRNKMESTYGVNLDEELGDMLRYQQAYKASARVFNVCNDLIDVILNMGR